MLRQLRTIAAALLVPAALLAAGCGGGNTTGQPGDQDVNHSYVVSEVGEILTIRKVDGKRPPASAADLASYEAGWPGGYKAAKAGDVVVVWGAPIQDGVADKVIAYEKQAPDSGGFVLMQDGKTVKKMTADEFKAAPKATKG